MTILARNCKKWLNHLTISISLFDKLWAPMQYAASNQKLTGADWLEWEISMFNSMYDTSGTLNWNNFPKKSSIKPNYKCTYKATTIVQYYATKFQHTNTAKEREKKSRDSNPVCSLSSAADRSTIVKPGSLSSDISSSRTIDLSPAPEVAISKTWGKTSPWVLLSPPQTLFFIFSLVRGGRGEVGGSTT